MIVVDASFIADGLMREPAASRALEAMLAKGETLHAPELLDLEVLSVIRRAERQRRMTSLRARQTLDDLSDLHLTRYPHGVLLRGAWRLRDNLSVYDGAYVALAELLDAPLVTADRGQASAAARHTSVAVEIIGI